MKKFLALIGIFILCSFPVLAQNSDPVAVDFNWQYEGGISLVISETVLDWGLIPLLTDPMLNEDWVECPVVPQIVISFKLPVTNRAQLVCETPADLMYNTLAKKPADYLKHEITGEFIAPETTLPNPEDGQVIMWTSSINGGKRVGDLLFKVWRHEEFGGVEYAFTGSAIYTVLDVVI